MPYFSIQEFLSTVNKSTLQRTTQFRCRIPVNLIGTTGELATQYPEAADLLSRGLLCESTRLPSRSFETTSLGIFGYDEKFPTYTTFTDLDCTFYTPLIRRSDTGPGSNDVLKLFSAWQNMVHQLSPLGSADPGNRGDMVLSFPDNYRLRKGMMLEMFDPFNARHNNGQALGINVGVSVPIFGKIGTIGTSFGNTSPDPESAPTVRYNMFNVFPTTVESAPVSWSAVDEIQRITVTFTYSFWSMDQV